MFCASLCNRWKLRIVIHQLIMLTLFPITISGLATLHLEQFIAMPDQVPSIFKTTITYSFKALHELGHLYVTDGMIWICNSCFWFASIASYFQKYPICTSDKLEFRRRNGHTYYLWMLIVNHFYGIMESNKVMKNIETHFLVPFLLIFGIFISC